MKPLTRDAPETPAMMVMENTIRANIWGGPKLSAKVATIGKIASAMTVEISPPVSEA